MLRTAFLAGFLATVSPVHSYIYGEPSQLPTLEYDYIVVGSGNAGGVVANRLSKENTVLVLEAGGNSKDVPLTQIPLLGPRLLQEKAVDWNYSTVPMPGLNGRWIPYGRGHILGGTSSTNFLVYNRGPRDDFNHWAKIGGEPKWQWDNVFDKFAGMNERFVPPNDDHNITGQYRPDVHFQTGEIDISLPGYPWPMDRRVIDLTTEFPDTFPFNIDVNDGEPLGIAWNQASVGFGVRSSSATSYLSDEYTNRAGFDILLGARVTKVIKTGTENGLPLFGAVEFSRDQYTPRTQVKARKEIILSAGSFNTPQILLLSGIGNKTELAELGIESIIDLPSVGKNATDHSQISNTIDIEDGIETFNQHTTPETINESIAEWQRTHKGPLSYAAINHVGYFRLPDNDPILEKYGDPTSGPTSPHYELLFLPGYMSLITPNPPYEGAFNTIMTVITSGTSIGSVTINSTNPFAPPVIDPNYLATELDTHVTVEAVRAVQKAVRSNSWKGYSKKFTDPALENAVTDEQIIAYARKNAAGLWHFAGSAGMSAKDAGYGVVDPDFRVKGAAGLRVVDASVFPAAPSAHPMGVIYLVAELASDMILNPEAKFREQVTSYSMTAFGLLRPFWKLWDFMTQVPAMN